MLEKVSLGRFVVYFVKYMKCVIKQAVKGGGSDLKKDLAVYSDCSKKSVRLVDLYFVSSACLESNVVSTFYPQI